MLIGRYPGDSYAGGNPWQLLTAVLGELFYIASSSTLKDIQTRGQDFPLDKSHHAWLKLLKLPLDTNASTLAINQRKAGDSVMKQLHSHVQGVDNRVDEQIDKNTGEQTSAEGLTWSYANILHSLYTRQHTANLMHEVLGIDIHVK